MGLFGPPNVEKLKAKRDVKGLIKALTYAKDEWVRLKSAEALGEIGDALAVEPLIVALKDSYNHARKSAACALGKIGDARAAEPLIAALKDNDAHFRKSAAEALGKIGGSRAVEPLIAALDDCWGFVRESVVEALAKIGDASAVEPLIGQLGSVDSDARQQAMEALVKIGVPAVGLLSAALNDRKKYKGYEREYRHSRAAEALGKIGDARAVEPLIAALEDGNKDVRKHAADALDQMGWKPTEDENGARYWVARENWNRSLALGQAAIPPLIAAIQEHYHTDYDYMVWSTLEEIGAPAVEPLIAALKDGTYVEAYLLGQIGDARAVEPLIAALEGSDRDMRKSAAEALGKIRDARAVEPLFAALKDGYEAVRNSAAKALQSGWPEMGARIQVALEASRRAELKAARREEQEARREEIEAAKGARQAAQASQRTTAHCPECGSPAPVEMQKRGLTAIPDGKFARLGCRECHAYYQIPLDSIDKAKGVSVKCSCGAIVFVPPSVWCETCGEGLSTGWQKQISAGREAEKAMRETDPEVKGTRALARDLKAAHGDIKSIYFKSHYPDFEIEFDFADGKRIHSGKSAGDIFGIFTFGYFGGGPTRLKTFLDELGLSMSLDEIKQMRPGTTMEVEGASLRQTKGRGAE